MIIKNKKGIEYSITGLLIGAVLIGLFASMFGLFVGELANDYDVNAKGVNFSRYDTYTGNGINGSFNSNELEKITNATTITQTSGFIDVIGGYFTSGYSALKTSAAGVKTVGEMIKTTASEDVPAISFISQYMVAIIFIIVFVGIFIAALLKWRT